MKKKIFLFAVVLCSLNLKAQKFKGLDISPMDAISYPLSHETYDKIIKIIYSRPQLKGRTVESLAKYGEVWRTGANEATEIIFYEDVIFGGKNIEAGNYSFFAIPGEKEWTIILNSDVNLWGAYSYNKDNDVIRVKAKVSKNEENIEAFAMAFDDEMNLYMAWGNTLITLPIKEHPKQKIEKPKKKEKSWWFF